MDYDFKGTSSEHRIVDYPINYISVLRTIEYEVKEIWLKESEIISKVYKYTFI